MNSIIEFIKAEDNFLIASHINPDGDSLGSVLAFTYMLRQLGKRAVSYCRDGVPPSYAFLPENSTIVNTLPEGHEDMALMLLDCNALHRAGLEGRSFRRSAVVDHHRTESSFGEVKWVEPEIPATGMMVYMLMKAFGIKPTPAMATNLFAAIAVDTGAFRFRNTTAEVLRVAADLTEAGAEPAEVTDALYQNWSRARFKLMKMNLDNMEMHGSICVSSVSEAMVQEVGARLGDTENFVNFPLMLADILISAFFREMEPGRWKVSLRSKGELNMAAVAMRFEGGGHINAAGCVIEADLPEAKQRILDALGNLLR